MTTKNGAQEIKKTITEIFEIEKLPEDKQEEMLGRIGGIIFQSVLVRVLPFFSAEELAEYKKMMDEKADIETVFDYFFEKVPNFLQIVVEESENFRRESAEVLAQIK